jgi:hypothetical protein
MCGSGSLAPPFLTPALDGGEWSALCPGFFAQGKSCWHPFCGRLGGPQNQSRCVKSRGKSIASAGNWTWVIQPVACHYTDWAVQALKEWWHGMPKLFIDLLNQFVHWACARKLLLVFYVSLISGNGWWSLKSPLEQWLPNIIILRVFHEIVVEKCVLTFFLVYMLCLHVARPCYSQCSTFINKRNAWGSLNIFFSLIWCK